MKREDCFKITNLFDKLDDLQKCLPDVLLAPDYSLIYKGGALKKLERTVPPRVTGRLVEGLETALFSEISRVRSEPNRLRAETEEVASTPCSQTVASVRHMRAKDKAIFELVFDRQDVIALAFLKS